MIPHALRRQYHLLEERDKSDHALLQHEMQTFHADRYNHVSWNHLVQQSGGTRSDRSGVAEVFGVFDE